MSLSAALNTAQGILSNTSQQTSIISRNIANVGNANYTRRAAELANNGWGAEVVNISRAANDALFRENITSISTASGQNTLLAGLDQIRALSGGNDYETAPSTVLTQFRDALQLFASKPGDSSAAQSAVAAGVDLANNLSDASVALQNMRRDTDAEIGREVEDLNKLLKQFEEANNAVKGATQSGTDPSDSLDERDRILKGISEIIGIKAVTRANNDMALYTSDGATLFETIPREVTFQRTGGFETDTVGNAVYVDGVPVKAGTGGATTATGSLGALLQLRDTVAPTYQMQLDEIARGLVVAVPDLFVYDASITGTPAAGVLMPGIAMSLSVNPALDPAVGGDPFELRDGIGHVDNPTQAAGYSARLDGYITALEAPIAFDVAALAGENTDLISYAADSLGWLEATRSQASVAAETKSAAYFRTTEALSNSTGVNLDEELARLIDLEQSYKASSRLISVVDEMLSTLLAVR